NRRNLCVVDQTRNTLGCGATEGQIIHELRISKTSRTSTAIRKGTTNLNGSIDFLDIVLVADGCQVEVHAGHVLADISQRDVLGISRLPVSATAHVGSVRQDARRPFRTGSVDENEARKVPVGIARFINPRVDAVCLTLNKREALGVGDLGRRIIVSDETHFYSP